MLHEHRKNLNNIFGVLNEKYPSENRLNVWLFFSSLCNNYTPACLVTS
jgi:hypothetical protein